MIAQIFSMFANAKVATFASIKTLTEVKIPKKWGLTNVQKYTYKTVQVAYSYESAVNRHLANEGKEKDFKALSLPWGEWLIPNRVISHKGKTYYRVYDYNGGMIEQTYFVNGHVATDEEMSIIKAWLKTKTTTTRQGVEDGNEVRPTSVCEDNILYFATSGVTYEQSEKLAEVSAISK